MRWLPGGVPAALAALALGACANAPARPEAPGPAADPGPKTPGAVGAVQRVALPPSPLTEEQRILHALNRLAYGPRPTDVKRVRQMGLEAWIEGQLDPARIPDEAAQRLLAAYPTLAMSPAELAREYPQPSREVREKMASGQMTREAMRQLHPPERRPYRIAAEMQAAKVARAVLSERQLEEVMVDFWFNHFNVFAHKGAVKWMLPAYEREAIRPHALRRFRDLVVATARHPAMLFYLDNWMSTRADLVLPAGPQRGRTLGLNENYARELLELHTLGVDGGYTQQDVIEVARAFTGWGLDRPRGGGSGGFVFRALAHDQGEKRVLGHVIPAGGGEQDGLRVIDLLVRHPSTARFISTKLVRRFTSDEPPPALVERVARIYQQTDGDIRAMLASIFSAPEFWSAEAYRAKIKRPLEVVASAVRALDGRLLPPGAPDAGGLGERSMTVEGATRQERMAERIGLALGGGFVLSRAVANLGEPLYEMEAPTGYPDVAEAWVNTGALLGRMNFALALAHNRLPGARVDLGAFLQDVDRSEPARALERLLAVILHGQVTPETRAVLARQLASPEITRTTADDRDPRNTDVEKILALVLGSPEFQRR